MSKFLESYVFLEADEEMDESERSAELVVNRAHLASYCKLVISGCLPLKMVVHVWRRYVEFSAEFGDLIKATLEKIMAFDRIQCARTVELTLFTAFRELRRNDANQINPKSKQFSRLKVFSFPFFSKTL